MLSSPTLKKFNSQSSYKSFLPMSSGRNKIKSSYLQKRSSLCSTISNPEKLTFKEQLSSSQQILLKEYLSNSIFRTKLEKFIKDRLDLKNVDDNIPLDDYGLLSLKEKQKKKQEYILMQKCQRVIDRRNQALQQDI